MSGIIRPDKEIIALSNTGRGDELTGEEKARFNVLNLDLTTAEFFSLILDLYVSGESQKSSLQSSLGKLLETPKFGSKQKTKIQQTIDRMINAINDIQDAVKTVLDPILGVECENQLQRMVAFQQLKSQWTRIEPDDASREKKLIAIQSELRTLGMFTLSEEQLANIENDQSKSATAKLDEKLKLVFYNYTQHRRNAVSVKSNQEETFIQLKTIVKDPSIWNKLLMGLRMEEIVNALVTPNLSFGAGSNTNIFISQVISKLPAFKERIDEIVAKLPGKQDNVRQRPQFFNTFFDGLDDLKTSDRLKLKKVRFKKLQIKKMSPAVTAITSNYVITTDKWHEICNQIKNKLQDKPQYSFIEHSDTALTIKETKGNIDSIMPITKLGKQIQVEIPNEWIVDSKLDKSRAAMIKSVIASFATLPQGTTLKIGNCKDDPKLAILLQRIVNKAGFHAKFDTTDGTDAAVSKIMPRSLRAAQANATNRSNRKVRIGARTKPRNRNRIP